MHARRSWRAGGCRGEDGRSVFFSFSFLPSCRFSSAFGSWHWCPSVVLPTNSGFSRTRQLARLGTTSRVHSSTRWYPQVCLRGVPGNPLRVKNDKSRNPRPQARAGNLVRNTHLVLVSVPFCGLSPRRHNFALGRAGARSLTCAPTAPRSREAPRKPGSARNPARAPPNIANPVRVFRLSGLCARPGTLGTRFATVK